MTPPSRPPNTTAETRLSLVASHAGSSSSHQFGRRLRPGLFRRGPARCTQRDDQVGEAHASACRLPYCSPLGISWGPTPQSSPQAHTHVRETVANASSISLPGGTVGWLWNLRSEQDYRAKKVSPATHQGPYYKTTTASGAKTTRRTSTLTRRASRQPQTNSVHRSPAKPSQGPVTPTPSTYDSDQRAPSHGPNH